MTDLWFALRHVLTAVHVLALGSAAFAAAGEGFSTNLGFSIQQQDETAWLVRPNGARFFSLGVCCVNQGASRQEFDSANPAYAAHDRPYEALTRTASALDLVVLKNRPDVARSNASQGVAPAPREPLAHFEPTLALTHWDRERGFVQLISEFPWRFANFAAQQTPPKCLFQRCFFQL